MNASEQVVETPTMLRPYDRIVMEEEFEHSLSIAKLSEALAAAQGEIEGAKKDSENPHFKSSYADLAAVWEACRKALAKYKIAVMQVPVTRADGVWLITQLACGGEWMRGAFKINPVRADAHGIGSVITYMRRYSLAAMVGVAPEDEDDDGNAAVGKDGHGGSFRKQASQQQANGQQAKTQAASKLSPELIEWEQSALETIQHCRSSGDEAFLEQWRDDNEAKFRELLKADRGRALALKAQLDSARAFLRERPTETQAAAE